MARILFRASVMLLPVLFLLGAGKDAAAAGKIFAKAQAERAQPFICRGLSGERFALDALLEEKRFLVLMFWGVNCQPCLKEISQLNDLYGSPRFREKANMIAVNTDGYAAEILRGEMERKNIQVSFPVATDEDQAVTNSFVDGFIPLTLLIDKERRILLSILGSRRGDIRSLEKMVLHGENPFDENR